MIRATLLTLLVLLPCACMSPPVWRSASVTPADPVPTLVAASAFNYEVRRHTLDLTDADVDWGEALESAVQYAVENPEEIDKALAAAQNAAEARRLILAAIAAAGPAMHEKAVAHLERQGFAPEYDSARSEALLQRSARQDFAWVDPRTAANPFGNPSDQQGLMVPGSFPMYGDESQAELAGFLASGSEREAFASIQGQFVPAAAGPAQGFTCMLFVFVLDPQGQLLFSGRTEGAAKSLEGAFDAALREMDSPVVQA